MERFDWKAYLEVFNERLLDCEEIQDSLPDAVVSAGWLGFEGGTESEIRDLEARLGVDLPRSYREFLQSSNGWQVMGVFDSGLLPAGEVAWFRDVEPETIEIWQKQQYQGEKPDPISDEMYLVYGPDQLDWTLRVEYLGSCLLLSDRKDDIYYLLNPEILTPSGEWEAWQFADWANTRYRSFRDLMEAKFQALESPL